VYAVPHVTLCFTPVHWHRARCWEGKKICFLRLLYEPAGNRTAPIEAAAWEIRT